MIIWLTGNTQSGKTTIAKRLQGPNTILLDGDEMRTIWTDLGLSKEDRWEQNLRVARLARLIESQGYAVIVSVICPYEDLRREIETITGCKFVYIPGGQEGKEYPYEPPKNPVMTVSRG